MIFNALISENGSRNLKDLEFVFGDPAVNVANDLELIMSGANPQLDDGTSIGGDVKFAISAQGVAIDYSPPQTEVERNTALNFNTVTAMASRTFQLGNALLWPDGEAPASVQDPLSGVVDPALGQVPLSGG